MDSGLSNDAERFLSHHIRSIAQLELLLVLRTTPTRWWNSSDMARELRVDPTWAQNELSHWSGRGLLEESSATAGQFRYQPRTSDIDRAVQDLAQAYLLNRVKVIEAIYRQPSPHIRALADAFKLRKEDASG